MSNSSPLPPAGPSSGRRVLLYGCAVLVLIAGLSYYAYEKIRSTEIPVDEAAALRSSIAKMSEGQKRADAYKDADGDLVADPPGDPAKLQKADELFFSLIGSDNTEETQQEWKDLVSALAKATGQKVTHRPENIPEHAQLAALRDGKLHITAFATGSVPYAVNTAGFVPLATPADADGKFSYQMEILVRVSSSVQTPADLKGKTIAFTTLYSNSGAKAPMVILKDQFKLMPVRDYRFGWTGTHQRSIKELAEGKHEAICVANDLLTRALAAGDIKESQFRRIFKSESFPPYCFGMAHDLPPETAAQVAKAFEDFRFEGTSLEKRHVPRGLVRFARVDYQRDWAYVRQTDEALARLFDGK